MSRHLNDQLQTSLKVLCKCCKYWSSTCMHALLVPILSRGKGRDELLFHGIISNRNMLIICSKYWNTRYRRLFLMRRINMEEGLMTQVTKCSINLVPISLKVAIFKINRQIQSKQRLLQKYLKSKNSLKFKLSSHALKLLHPNKLAKNFNKLSQVCKKILPLSMTDGIKKLLQ